jgi:DNA-directed RNA polymerase sigma subunit (sigma70/sigma32)
VARETSTLERVRRHAEKLKALTAQAERERALLYAAIRDARREGASLELIATVAGYTRQRVDQILRKR